MATGAEWWEADRAHADGLLTMPITLTVPLDLPDVRVLAHRMLEDGTVLIEVESTLRTTHVTVVVEKSTGFMGSTDRSGCGACRCLGVR